MSHADAVYSVSILVLQGLTAAWLTSVAVSLSRAQGFRSLLDRAHGHICRCSEHLRSKSPEPEVDKFHFALCDLLVVGCRWFLPVLLFRLVIFQLYLLSDTEHLLSRALDISSITAYSVNLFLVAFRSTVKPKTLDLWYVVNQAISVLAIILCSPEELYSMSLITLLPRFLVGLIPKHAWLAVLGNLVHWVLALRHVNFELQSETFAEQTAMLGIVLGGILAVRQQIFHNVKLGLNLKTRTIDFEAVSSLLLGFCDAVVEVEENSLTLTEDSRQLSTMLLHGHGISAGGLAGSEFLSFFTPEDRGHIEESLTTGSKNALALNARMLDCLGNLVRVELLHVQFRNATGQVCRLVGMREFQDMSSVVKEMGPEPVELSRVEVPEDSTVLFNASTFDILATGKGFQQLCSTHGKNLDIQNDMSIFELSTSTGPNSLSRHLQELINSWDDSAWDPSTHLDRVDLLGGLVVDLKVVMQRDEVLDELIGTLQVTRVIVSQSSKLTQSNLATLARNARRSSKSRGSKRREKQHGTQQSAGSILNLRRPPVSL